MTGPTVLLDEHVGRVFETVLRERGYETVQAKDRFGEGTVDRELLEWCADRGVVLLSNNARDFVPLHRDNSHAGIVLYRDQGLPDRDPEGVARALDAVFEQYGNDGLEDEIVRLEAWYDWLHESDH